ncbi:cytochrome P450 [Nocardia carnea]|uniref:cytochrome P450 n=1 Tax=Nocardia carnea TaxID=37328 RepID=UPI002458DE08|nr:cytochrome P450 [Nocardia carnea]
MSDSTRNLPFERPEPLEPPPAYAELRSREPVAAVTTSEGKPAWLVTSYEAVATVLGDPRFGVVAPGEISTGGATLLQDGAPHQRLRRLVGKAFTSRRIEALRPRVQQLADEQLTVLTASGKPADLVAGFAAPLSIAVITELLGVEITERDRFRELADAAGRADFLADGAGRSAEQAWAEFAGYVGTVIAAKRGQLGNDLLSTLIAAGDSSDGRLDDYELTTLTLTILASGYLTATNAISVGVLQLVAEGRLATLGECTAAELEAVVEEVIRLQIGQIGEAFPRWAHEDVELAGRRVRAGDMVLARLGAANRDPAHFPEPDIFDPNRNAAPEQAGRHMAFGRGPHHCLGAALARLEIGIALQALAFRLPRLRLHGNVHDIEWTRSHADTGPIAVQVTW